VPESYVGWNLPPGQRETVGRTTYVAGNSVGQAATTIKGPTTLRANESVGGATRMLAVSRDPDYTYRLDYLVATNEGALPVVPAAIPPTPAGGSVDDRKRAAEAFNKATGNYRVYNKASATTREMVGLNNLGEITFTWGSGDAKTVIHTLRWRNPDTPHVIFTTYFVPLDPNDPAFPELGAAKIP
jgi:hypothetical protein